MVEQHYIIINWLALPFQKIKSTICKYLLVITKQLFFISKFK